ncbi:hypothetical protein ISS03_03680 [Patescibacteria group bacterium]|nr:hypothetical protein [Patescibacteria group bacterium]
MLLHKALVKVREDFETLLRSGIEYVYQNPIRDLPDPIAYFAPPLKYEFHIPSVSCLPCLDPDSSYNLFHLVPYNNQMPSGL